MGNCFGKESGSFAGNGRTLESTPAAKPVIVSTSAPAPKKSSYTPTPTQGRVLGTVADASGDDPKSAAARAAEERAKSGQVKGKLGRQLDAQKAQTQNSTLAAVSAENRAARDADVIAETRTYN